MVGISDRTFGRWKSGGVAGDRRKGAAKRVPRKLSDDERQAIVDVACSDEFRDLNPYEIVSTMLDRRVRIRLR